MNNEQWPPEWINELIEDHYERVAEDPKPHLSLADTIWEAYERGRTDSDLLDDALFALAVIRNFYPGIEKMKLPPSVLEFLEKEA